MGLRAKAQSEVPYRTPTFEVEEVLAALFQLMT